MKHIKLYENWIKLQDEYRGESPRPGSRYYGGDEGEWKFIWNEENNKKDITSELDLYNGNVYIYEIYQPDGLVGFEEVGKLFLNEGTDLANSLFSNKFMLEKDDINGRGLRPSQMSNNMASSYRWNKRFNEMVSQLIDKDVLVHTNYSDVMFISTLKEPDYKRSNELGIDKWPEQGDLYSIKKSKPYDRNGKERRFFDENGKEIIPNKEPYGIGNPTVQGSITQFLEKINK